MSMDKDFATLAEEGNKKEKTMPIVPIVAGEVFLQDKIADDQHCYVCKKEFNKFNDKDMLLIRIHEHKMGFVCPHHRGVTQEFVKQYKVIPGGWEKHVEKDYVESNDSSVADPDSNSTGSSNKTRKRTRKRTNRMG